MSNADRSHEWTDWEYANSFFENNFSTFEGFRSWWIWMKANNIYNL